VRKVWNGTQELDDVTVFDTETHLFRPGVMAPELVCVTVARPGYKPVLYHHADLGLLALIESWLKGPTLLVGHHVVYDLAVLSARWPHLTRLVFEKYDRDEITCTKLRQQLLDIAAGEFRGYTQRFEKPVLDDAGQPVLKEDGTPKTKKGARWISHEYDLAALARRNSGAVLDKDTWRLRYGELYDVPLSKWPDGAKTYPLDDARHTLDIFLTQERHVEYLDDQFRQARSGWARHLTSVWGLRTHGPGVERLEQETLAALKEIEGNLVREGLVREDGSRNVKAARERMIEVCKAAGKEPHETPKGEASLDADACKYSEDPVLEEYAELTALKGVLAKDVPMLRLGTDTPVHTTFNIAASGRSTSSKPNVQNPRRLPGIRECFVPRPGKVFAQADFSALELHTLAQTCVTLFGQSRLAEVLNAGGDPHSAMACLIAGIPLEEGDRLLKESKGPNPSDRAKRFVDARQAAKPVNFGFPGGLGAKTLVEFARQSYGVIFTQAEAMAFREAWFVAWPEMRLFFDYVGKLPQNDHEEYVLTQIGSNRMRGGCTFTSACNSFFQGLGADAASRAHYLVTRACYAEPEHLLFGSRAVNFVHDEVILEVEDDALAGEKAHVLGEVMIRGANEFLPDVPARVEPLLARRWSKKAKPVFVEGRLVPWEMAS
jgi:DNA polymerase I